MKTSGVLVRFLSLLDVTLVLLGVVLLLLVSMAKTIADSNQDTKAELGKLLGKEIEFLYAGWKKEQKGKCYRLNEDLTIGDSVDMNGGEWLKNKAGKEKVVALVIEKGAWTSAWVPSRISSLEKKWNTKIAFFNDIDLQKGKGK